MISQVAMALVLGLIGGLVPGPVLAATFTEILQSGFYKSLRIILWAMLTETLGALLTLLVLSSLGLSQAFFAGLSFIGAGILIWIALQLWKIRSLDMDSRVHFSLGKISAMIMANGVFWTFWITVCIPQALGLARELPFGSFLFLALVEIGWLISTVGVALAFSGFRKALSSPRIVPYMFKFFSIVFAYFAFHMIYTSAAFFLGI